MNRFLSLAVLALSQFLFLSPAAQPGPSHTGLYAPAADEAPAPWRYTTRDPGGHWSKPGFDDSQWLQGRGGFGTAGTPGAVIGTEWNTPRIWLRREFTLPGDLPSAPRLWLIYDEAPEIYLNGVLALKRSGWITEYEEAEISKEALASLKPGTNLLAVLAGQTYGGQSIDVGLIDAAPREAASGRWTVDRAWQWYTNQSLPLGFNYVPANSISYTEMWMGYAFNPALIDRELALAQQVGFNCLRVVLPFVVWEAEPAAFRQRFEAFLAVCDRRGLKVVPCFFDDCVFGPIADPEFGRQPDVVPGWYANGWTPSPGHKHVRNPAMRPALERYVKDILTAHRNDRRVLCWDLYNEPGNAGLGNASLPLLRRAFQWAREVGPAQPVTSGVWGGSPVIRRFLLRESDIVTFHNYNPATNLAEDIGDLKRQGRPVIATEWLNRDRDSRVETCLPVFVRERVGALHWGLVNGKTQTDLPWGHRPGQPPPAVWQHDIFRPDHSPYDPKEIELFRALIRSAASDR